MKQVEKHGNVFSLLADPEEELAKEARSAHSGDCQVLSSGNVTLELLAAIVLHLARRLFALEQRR